MGLSVFSTLFLTVLMFGGAIWTALFTKQCYLPTTFMEGKVVVITGACSGLGFSSTKLLAEMEAKVVLTCRTLKRAEEARREIESSSKNNLHIEAMELDLSDLKSIKTFATEFKKKQKRLDVLMNNAGVINIYGEKEFTKDGIEETIAVNHVAHFYLTRLLLDMIKKSKGRIVNLTSEAHRWASKSFLEDFQGDGNFALQQYFNSKLGNVLFSLELQKRLKGTGVCVYSVNPVI